MGFTDTGKVSDVDSLRLHLKAIPRPAWCKGVTLHHCASPSLAQRPQGFKLAHLQNLREYYKNELGWSEGPHFFIDEDQIWGLTSVLVRGTHAKSFNATHIGIEVLGDYDSEDPTSGRGLECWKTTMAAVQVLLEWLGLPPDAFNFHRDDPKTNKTCPGKLVTRDFLMTLMYVDVGRPNVPLDKPAVLPLAQTLQEFGVTPQYITANIQAICDAIDGEGYDRENKVTLAPWDEILELRLPISAFTRTSRTVSAP